MSSSPKAPPPPDPTVVAGAQTASNIATAQKNAQLNRVNQYTPWGSQTYSQVTTPDVIDQAGYDAAMQKYNAAKNTPASAPASMAFDPAYMDQGGHQSWMPASSNTPVNTPVAAAPNIADYTTKGNSDTWNSTINLAPEQQKLLDSSNKISQSMADLGQAQIGNVQNSINKPLDFSGLQNVQQNALQSTANSSPIQMGINTNGVGDFQNYANYGHIQDNLDTSGVPKLLGGDALAGAMKDAQNASYNQQKSYLDPQWQQDQHDLENKLTQQGVMQNSDAWNRAVDDFGRNKTFAYNNALQSSVGLGNAAQAQLYGQGLSSNQNAFSQAIGSGNFANGAQAQGFGQAQTNAQLNNSVVRDQFAQAQAEQAAALAAQSQQFNQSLQSAQLNNQSAGQAFSQSMGARNQGINELLQQQQNPLNVLNALRTGAQVTTPTFGQTPQTNMAGTDTMSPVNNAFNAQMGAYNGQVATNNNTTSAAASVASAAAMAIAF